ncbi:serine/threonine-protein phosphatase [Thiohalocapsa marina]|uniref:Serine/threonine-protein phosphatase n=2 Tax=Thiohalocapsa marina TaxID=424902 RepID=A0A5M8FUK8_9GAMM|nr:serine/threonine-protein phosphatase [Thiohalocapsa marina]
MRWKSAAATHPGCVRSVNQDAFLDRPDLGLWAVADGMGGHAAGERASALVVETLARLPSPRFLGRSTEQLESLIQEANRQLIAEAAAKGDEIIGTTLVALLALGGACALLWVGDSRIYRLREGRLTQLTTDHTEVQQWVAQGMLSPDEADAHPHANVLSRAIGAEDELQIDTAIDSLHPGDRYLLCSDGLSKELSRERIGALLASGAPTETVQQLIETTCEAGARDNVTALVIEFSVV